MAPPVDASAEEAPRPTQLPYIVEKASSHSMHFTPDRITEDRPGDEDSRWCCSKWDPQQGGSEPWLRLKLPQICRLDAIEFGKFNKPHVCNLREFRVVGSLDGHAWVPLLHAGLQNNTQPEVISLRCHSTRLGCDIPLRYIKIIPLQSWHADFNFTVWHVKLHGQALPASAVANFWDRLEQHAMTAVYQFTRKRKRYNVADAIRLAYEPDLGSPLAQQLFTHLVEQADYTKAEQVVGVCLQLHMFQDWAQMQPAACQWHRCFSSLRSPSARSGHQLCSDDAGDHLFMYGGYDGSRDLSELWHYSTRRHRWTQLDQRGQGPGAVSCHRMVYTQSQHTLWVCGGYVDASAPGNVPARSGGGAIFKYDISTNLWTRFPCEYDIVALHDHAMVYDTRRHQIIIIGGRVSGEPEPGEARILFFDIDTGAWQARTPLVMQGDVKFPPSLVGHVALFTPHETDEDAIVIVGGKANRVHVPTIFRYRIASNMLEAVRLQTPWQLDTSLLKSFAQRGVKVDQKTALFCHGLTIDQADGREAPTDRVWLYDVETNAIELALQKPEPKPAARYAHALACSASTKSIYMFGGSVLDKVSRQPQQSRKLGDFWELRLIRPSELDAACEILWMLRRQHFRDLCRRQSKEQDGQLDALNYLRQYLTPLASRRPDRHEEDLTYLLQHELMLSDKQPSTEDAMAHERQEIFDRIMLYFSESDRPPNTDFLGLFQF